ncbi:MAG: hypothetical protein IPL08_19920 [Saprospiraceae bacterium]|nr:hypothetical protein [Saprospiraceae bacterium]
MQRYFPDGDADGTCDENDKCRGGAEPEVFAMTMMSVLKMIKYRSIVFVKVFFKMRMAMAPVMKMTNVLVDQSQEVFAMTMMSVLKMIKYRLIVFVKVFSKMMIAMVLVMLLDMCKGMKEPGSPCDDLNQNTIMDVVSDDCICT